MRRGTTYCYWLEPADKEIILANMKRKGIDLLGLSMILRMRNVKNLKRTLDGEISLNLYRYRELKRRGFL